MAMTGQGCLKPRDRAALVDVFRRLALEAGDAILAIYAAGPRVRAKSDQSPVSDADETAEALILAGLSQAAPHIPAIGEEAVAHGAAIMTGDRFILVDPLDGTREFISRNGEFTVNIALIEDGAPTAGVVYAPALGRLWATDGAGGGAWTAAAVGASGAGPHGALGAGPQDRAALRTRRAPAAGLTALASRSHGDAATEAFLRALPIAARETAGSSLKFCRIAAGEADVYPRFGPTMEWDTAAGDAVLRAAGGCVVDATGAPLAYGKPGLRNGAFVAWGENRPVMLAES